MVPQMILALKIPRIEPAKVFVAVPADRMDHGGSPERIGQPATSFFELVLHFLNAVPAPQCVAVVAGSTLLLAEQRADTAAEADRPQIGQGIFFSDRQAAGDLFGHSDLCNRLQIVVDAASVQRNLGHAGSLQDQSTAPPDFFRGKDRVSWGDSLGERI